MGTHEQMTTVSSMMERVRNADLSWAKVVSNILSPPVVSALMFTPIAIVFSATSGRALLWCLLYITLTSVLPTVYIAWEVQRGWITDIHMPIRRERFRPYIVTIACSIIAWLALGAFGASPILPIIALISLVQVIVMALITLFWQISMHTMTITGAVIAYGIFFGMPYALLTIPMIMLVGAARLYLKRHTPAQVIAGTVIGSLVPMLVIFLLPI